jgi:hypothetical protein
MNKRTSLVANLLTAIVLICIVIVNANAGTVGFGSGAANCIAPCCTKYFDPSTNKFVTEYWCKRVTYKCARTCSVLITCRSNETGAVITETVNCGATSDCRFKRCIIEDFSRKEPIEDGCAGDAEVGAVQSGTRCDDQSWQQYCSFGTTGCEEDCRMLLSTRLEMVRDEYCTVDFITFYSGGYVERVNSRI